MGEIRTAESLRAALALIEDHDAICKMLRALDDASIPKDAVGEFCICIDVSDSGCGFFANEYVSLSTLRRALEHTETALSDQMKHEGIIFTPLHARSAPAHTDTGDVE